MLLTWGSGLSQAAQVRDLTTGTAVGTQFTVGVADHLHIAYKPFPDDSVAYPAGDQDWGNFARHVSKKAHQPDCDKCRCFTIVASSPAFANVCVATQFSD